MNLRSATSRRFSGRWDLRARIAVLIGTLLCLLIGPSTAKADDLQYSQLDSSTVRVFSFKGIKSVNVRGSTGRSYVLGEPDAGHGSGLVIANDGLILTARHVVEDAKIIAVLLPGRDRPLLAQVVYADKEHDHAFLAVNAQFKEFVDIFQHKNKLAVRQTVFVVGYPLDASRTRPQSQQGIVSGTLPDGSLQLGIALNPGNSGGPVVDDKERFLGIAVARADPRAGAQGIGVAVPADQIAPSYRRIGKSRELAAARAELTAREQREPGLADLLASLLTADDSNNAWQAVEGKANAAPTSPSVDRRLNVTMRSSTVSADVVGLAAAQLWNAAAVAEARGQSADSQLKQARDFAQRAAGMDRSIGQRSPFISLVLEGGKPSTSTGNANVGATEGGNQSNSDALHQLLSSLETDKSLPVVRIGPSFGITTPFQLVGIGVVAKIAVANGVNIDARYYYGAHTSSGGASGTSGSHMFEALAGIPLKTWNGTTTAQLIVDIENNPGLTVYRYVPGQVPTVNSFVLEAGVLSGPVNLRLPDPAGVLLGTSAKQIFVPEAGVRYTYFYHATSPYLARSTRSSVELSAHALGPLLGVDEGAMNADGKPIQRAVPGFKGEVAWQSAPLSLGQTEIGAGYFPGSGWIFVHIGWTYLFY